jgi:hypothetical protein
MRFFFRLKPASLIVLAISCGTTENATAETSYSLKDLFHFGESLNSSTGDNPLAGLFRDKKGNLFGTTFEGGPQSSGIVFELSPNPGGTTPWTETVLYSFPSNGNQTVAYGPQGTLVMDENGVLYGTHRNGGKLSTINQDGAGYVFRLIPPSSEKKTWTYETLYTFTGGADGNEPYGALLLGKSGNLYGTTVDGGDMGACTNGGLKYGCGVVYELSPPAAGKTKWIETILYKFKNGSDGLCPAAGLVSDATGALYGTTAGKELFNNFFASASLGTVFRLSPPTTGHTAWTLATLHRFQGKEDGDTPFAPVVRDELGRLYGTTQEPLDVLPYAGTAFRLDPPVKGKTVWTQTVLHHFTSGADGGQPSAGLLMDATGALYGTTLGGGSPYPPTDPRNTCQTKNYCGVVFKLIRPSPPSTKWSLTVLHWFNGGVAGEFPNSEVIRDLAGNLYGTTSGDVNAYPFGGSVYELTP